MDVWKSETLKVWARPRQMKRSVVMRVFFICDLNINYDLDPIYIYSLSIKDRSYKTNLAKLLIFLCCFFN